MADYEFRYAPLTGRLTGKQMIEQTEQAINQLSSLVDSAAGQVEIISTLANEANENAATALETAEEALATTGRTYLTVSTQTDANNYYDSQLIYIADSTSTNIPVADTGMLEVKTNDNKTACEQVFIADSSGDAYYRHGDITAETVGDVTTYTVTWGGWSSQPASQTYVQQELTNYLPLSGGTVSGDLAVSGDITGNLTGNVTGLASGNLPLAGGTMTGGIKFDVTGEIGYRGTTHESTPRTSKQLIVSATDIDHWADDYGAKIALHTYDTTGTNANEDGSFNLLATDGTNSQTLQGKPSGLLNWNGMVWGNPPDENNNTYYYGLYQKASDPHKYGGVAFTDGNNSVRPQLNMSSGDGTHRSYLALHGDSAGGLEYTHGGISGSLTDGSFLTVRHVNVTTRSGTNNYSISAPAVSGYQFLCWVMSATSGYVNYSYIASAWSANTAFWMGNAGNGSVDCTALYVRKW